MQIRHDNKDLTAITTEQHQLSRLIASLEQVTGRAYDRLDQVDTVSRSLKKHSTRNSTVLAPTTSIEDDTGISDLIRVVNLLNDELLRMNAGDSVKTETRQANADSKQPPFKTSKSNEVDMPSLADDTNDPVSASSLAKLYGFNPNSVPKREFTISVRAKPEPPSLPTNTPEVKKQEDEEQAAQTTFVSDKEERAGTDSVSIPNCGSPIKKDNTVEEKDNTSNLQPSPSTPSLPTSQNLTRRQDSPPRYDLRRRATDTATQDAEVYVLDLTSDAEPDNENRGHGGRRQEAHLRGGADRRDSAEERSPHPAERPVRETIKDSRGSKRRRTPSPRTPPNQMIVCRTPGAPKRRK
ncbi:hypothetical protein OHC33_000400 [Knufia fluminis]|uniref:Uncharacterized protein n=1 Tax=Knufia fluminis TaxID=191047 RepID=A0AAN8ETN6_9EURO|nr:hypothetical protein OHC33_000400 [Knufia fluminis]